MSRVTALKRPSSSYSCLFNRPTSHLFPAEKSSNFLLGRSPASFQRDQGASHACTLALGAGRTSELGFFFLAGNLFITLSSSPACWLRSSRLCGPFCQFTHIHRAPARLCPPAAGSVSLPHLQFPRRKHYSPISIFLGEKYVKNVKWCQAPCIPAHENHPEL